MAVTGNERGPSESEAPSQAAEEAPYANAPAYAALDLGTNNCRLLVARPSRRGFKVIDAFSRIIRLGEGIATSGRLTDGAMTRTIQALQICASKISRHRVHKARLVATEACRVASNAESFLERVRRDLDLQIEVLSREEEAKLAVSGCASLIDPQSDLVLVFDIGGGSSELVWLDIARWRRDGARRNGGRTLLDRLDMQSAILAWTSLPVGVVTLAERFGSGFIGPREFAAMVGHVRELLDPFEEQVRLAPMLEGRRVHLLGTSGTVTTVAGVHMKLPRYDRSRVDGTWLTTSQASAVTRWLVVASHEARVAQPCIGRDRADLVLAGCAILEAIVATWPCERMRVADRGLREGILTTLIAEDTGARGADSH
jgi:exopolyphosphatase/guanosine-5'-triphosphate,3'-diphosphate pyrophosphatase